MAKKRHIIIKLYDENGVRFQDRRYWDGEAITDEIRCAIKFNSLHFAELELEAVSKASAGIYEILPIYILEPPQNTTTTPHGNRSQESSGAR